MAQDFEAHLVGEEAHIQPIIRKYMPLVVHKEVVRRVFKETEIEKMYKYIPAVLNHLPHATQVTRRPGRCTCVWMLCSRQSPHVRGSWLSLVLVRDREYVALAVSLSASTRESRCGRNAPMSVGHLLHSELCDNDDL